MLDNQKAVPSSTLALEYRNYRDASDFDSISRVLNASRDADAITEARTADDLRNLFTHTKNLVVTRDIFLVETENQLVGFAWCKSWQEISGKFIHHQEIQVIPEWRDRNIEAELLQKLKQHQYAAFPEHNANTLGWFEIEIEDTRTWLVKLVQANGYAPARYFDSMVRDNLENIPDAALPDGIETRPVTSAQL